MLGTERLIDWHELHAADHAAPAVVDPRRRLRIGLAGFAVLLLVVFGRVVALEMTQGEDFRRQANRALERSVDLPGVRGRILARDGSVLAHDKKVLSLAVHYRYLQQPPDARWLRRTARSRLTGAQRRDHQRLELEQSRLRAEHRELARRLAHLAGLTTDQWNQRAEAIQQRVERIADSVNQRRQEAFARQRQADEDDATDDQDESRSAWQSVGRFALETLRASMDESTPGRITVAEELDYHVMAEDVPLDVVAEIEAHPEEFPGVKIVESSRRDYPHGSLAAHLLGYLGPVDDRTLADESNDAEPYYPGDRAGRSGMERTYEPLLRGRHGTAIQRIDHSGSVLSTYRKQEPGVGRDLVLTLDPALQRTAEQLLAAAVARRALEPDAPQTAGGAVVVMDVHNGAILAAASAPSFDPNAFSGKGDASVAALLDDAAHPLFDRVAQMAIPPGSVFKVVTATALLESGTVDPYAELDCKGYLHDPGSLRCQIFVATGHGHGPVTMLDALAQSCNVYFFHHATAMGPDPLVHWALQLGFGLKTGSDLPGETAGNLPSPRQMPDADGRRWRTGDTQMIAIGQGRLAATPLQVARMIAAVGNGGRLVTPHVADGLGLPQLLEGQSADEIAAMYDDPIHIRPPRPIPDLKPETLAIIRQGLKRVVADHVGSAHGTVYLDTIEIAGKTGTAQTGTDGGDHAWFAGYVPADRPRVAIVVALEHAGSGGEAAGPVAKRLVLRMQQLGYFGRG